MDTVACGAIKGGMLALVLPELRDLLSMASGTGIRDVARKCNLQGSVRVLVAGKTIFQFEMRLSHVALVALRDRVFYCRGMTGMAA